VKTPDLDGSDGSISRPSRVRRRRRRVVLRIGALALLVAGGAMLGRVGYEELGTGIETTRAQTVLKAEIEHQGFPKRVIPGGAVGYIQIPKLDVDMAFVQGVDLDALAKGPGHYPDTPLPGRRGNVAIAGHRTTHAAPFWSLNVLKPGDQIILETRRGRFVYEVRWVKVVTSDAWWVVAPTEQPSLTLTSCYPRFSSRQRIAVRAVQVSRPGHRGSG
jgi:sortase A